MIRQSNEKKPFKFSNYTLIILDEEYRKSLIQEGIRKGGSMRQLGRIMGYTSSSPNWSIKLILSGKQGIPFHRLKRLCQFLNVPLTEVLNHIIEIK